MQIPSDIAYIKKVSEEVENFLKSNNADNSVIFDIRLCLEEAVKNAIIHGNKNDKRLPVFVSYSLEGDSFTMEVEDRGDGFDVNKVPDPTLNENLLREGGRGVFLIHKLMDKVAYNDKKNKIFMVKSIKRNKGGYNAY